MQGASDAPNGRHDLTSTWIEVTIRLAVLALLVYWSLTLIRPFFTIAIWSMVLTVALYPVYDWMVRLWADGGGSRPCCSRSSAS